MSVCQGSISILNYKSWFNKIFIQHKTIWTAVGVISLWLLFLRITKRSQGLPPASTRFHVSLNIDDERLPPPSLNFDTNSSDSFNDSNAIASALFSSVKILCLINTSRRQLINRAIHVNATWARRCNKALFLSYDENIDLPYLDLKVPESRYHLWNKIRALFRWVSKNEIDNFDFFLRADDDAYFIMENLRLLLLPYNPENATYFGCRFKKIVKNGYMSGGAGYILSREAVRQIVPAFDDPEKCPQKNENKEDAKIGACVEKLEIQVVDTRDNQGRHRMLPWQPWVHFRKGLVQSHFDYLYYPYMQTEAYECCADHMISFHYVYKDVMYLFEFLIYYSRVIGSMDDQWLNALDTVKNTNLSLIETLKQFSVNITMG